MIWHTHGIRCTMELMRYTVVLQQESDGGYVVKVPALPGCVSQGDSRQEAMANIQVAAELYVEDCIASGDPIPLESETAEIELKVSA